MRHCIRPTPLLMKKLAFLCKHGDKIQITPTTLAISNIHIQIPRFCEFSIGLYMADFIDMVKNTDSIDILDNTVTYSYSSKISFTQVNVEKTAPLLDLNYNVDIPSPSVSIKVGHLPMVTKDDCHVTFRGDFLTVESYGLIKTKVCVPAEKLEGGDAFKCRVRSKDLRIIESMDGEHIVNFFDDCIVIYGLESETATAAIVNVLY